MGYLGEAASPQTVVELGVHVWKPVGVASPGTVELEDGELELAVPGMTHEYKDFFLSKVKNNCTSYSIFFFFLKEDFIILPKHMAE